jgi:lipoprotein-anchoring transpeptidase ErfK/SrfK
MEKEPLMKSLSLAVASFAAIALSLAIAPVAQAQQPPPGTIVKNVTPNELAKAFAADVVAAAKEYSPRGPAGTVINTDGAIETEGQTVFLKNNTSLKIQLHNAVPPAEAGKWAAVLKSASFMKYDARTKTIHLDGKGVKFQRIID